MTARNSAGQRTPIPPSTPPVPPTTTIHLVRLTMPGIRALCILAAVVAPGVLLGATIAYRIWRRLRPQPSGRWASAIVLALIGALFVPVIVWLWPLRLLFGLLPHDGNIVVSVIGEALWGPLVLQVLLHVAVFDQHPPRMPRSHQATSASHTPSTTHTSPPSPSPPTSPWAHPPGAIRLGSDKSGQPFDLSLTEITQHVFIPGLSNTGKTTTLMRLADGALAHGYGVVIIDCKGGDLRIDAERVARTHGLTPYIVSTSTPDSYGYNPCTGRGYSVANKIVGALSFGEAAGIYRDVALGVIPPVVDAMRAVGRPVTLDHLQEALAKGNIRDLAIQLQQETGDKNRDLYEILKGLEGEGGPFANGREGLRHRLLAFRVGSFGDLLRKEPALMWHDVLAQPSVAYLELPVLGADQDVDLLGRVILQDIKGVAKVRIDAQVKGQTVVPILLIIDEFAALEEAEQINDLLLQGRAAAMRVVVASQHLPEDATLRKAVVGADLLLVHRLQVEDAEMIAKQVGTRDKMETSFSMDDNRDPQSTGPHQSTTNIRLTEEFNVKPQTLANLSKGQIAVRSVSRTESYTESGWCDLVMVHRGIGEE